MRTNFDNTKHLCNRIIKNIHERTDALANTGAAMVESDMRNYRTHGGTGRWGRGRWSMPTGASAASIYRVKTDGDSSYNEAAARFTALVGPAGRPVGELVLDEYRPRHGRGVAGASFGSCSLIVGFWEYGHHNYFTGRVESAPLISWTAFVLYKRMKTHYLRILDDWETFTGS